MKQWQRGRLWGLAGLVFVVGWGCTRHTISESVRQQADSTVSFEALQANAATYTDRIVIVGGTIVSTHPLAQKTLVTVVQHPLDRDERPLQTDRTAGRFMALCDTYLDPVVYAQGRQMTVAGRVLGTRQGKVGERDYVYPLLSCLETELWPYAPLSTGRRTPWGRHHKSHHHHDHHHE